MHTSHPQFIGSFPNNYGKAPILVGEVFQLCDRLIWWAVHPALWFSLASCRSLSFFLSFSQIILATSCALRYENHNSRGCIGSAAMCVYLKRFTCGTSMPACSQVFLQHVDTAPRAYLSSNKHSGTSPLQALVWKKYSVWHWTSKCREVDGITEGKAKHPTLSSVYFILPRLAGLAHQGLGVFSSCEALCVAALVIRQATASKERERGGAVNRFEKCAERWMRSHWGTSKCEDAHRWCYTLPSKHQALKNKEPTHHTHCAQERTSAFKWHLRRPKCWLKVHG